MSDRFKPASPEELARRKAAAEPPKPKAVHELKANSVESKPTAKVVKKGASK